MSVRRLLIGTHNPAKVREIEELLRGSRWRVEALPDDAPTYEESGSTFADNARGKALFYAERYGLPTLADDSGLVVDALDGEPGVESARWIDPDLDPPARNRALLERLAGIPREDRTARFVCHVALAHDGRIVFETTGTCEGRITGEPRGDAGFGYDPVFFSPELGRTFAEATRADKSSVSHRGRAVRAMAVFLGDWAPRRPAEALMGIEPRASHPLSVIVGNLVATVLTAAVVGPSVAKLEGLGLVGWAARAPFYLLPLCLSPLILRLRPRLLPAVALGVSAALPLALWAIATRCPPVVPVAYGVSVTGQAVLLAWMVRRRAAAG